MYKFIITNITDKQGVPKQEFLDELKESHPDLIGELLWPQLLAPYRPLLFLWDDDSGKMLRTSDIEKITGGCNFLKITTKNSIYILERVPEVKNNEQ